MTQATRIYRHSGKGTDWAALMLGAGLGLTLALQMTTVRASDFQSVYAVVVTVSRLLALTGTYFAIVGIFLVARIPWVERGVGHDRLVTWHRKLGPWSLYAIGAHVLLITVGFAGQDGVPLYKEMRSFLTTYEWMWAALAGFVLMVLVGVTSYKKARAKMSYETWWMVHVLTYAAVAASLKVNLRVEKIVVEGPGVVSVIMKGRNLAGLGAKGGWRVRCAQESSA
jgi:predicted ferric reductase